jgi:hypothetical protein
MVFTKSRGKIHRQEADRLAAIGEESAMRCCRWPWLFSPDFRNANDNGLSPDGPRYDQSPKESLGLSALMISASPPKRLEGWTRWLQWFCGFALRRARSTPEQYPICLAVAHGIDFRSNRSF